MARDDATFLQHSSILESLSVPADTTPKCKLFASRRMLHLEGAFSLELLALGACGTIGELVVGLLDIAFMIVRGAADAGNSQTKRSFVAIRQ